MNSNPQIKIECLNKIIFSRNSLGARWVQKLLCVHALSIHHIQGNILPQLTTILPTYLLI